MDELIRRAADGMRRAGFEVVEVKTALEARDYLLAQIGKNQSVGVGGSLSVRANNTLEMLAEKGCRVYSHWGAAPEKANEILKNAREADVYLTSANAVTKDGALVLIDGRGNRVGAVCDGPHDVYFVISHSKVVDGGLSAAIARIKSVASPQNTRRLGIDTPCARTGKCGGAACTNSICCLTLALEHAPKNRRMVVVLVEEAMGY